MTAGIIQLCGAYGGTTNGPTRFNKKGMFENGEIRDKIVKPYLRSIGVDPLGQFPLPDLSKGIPSIPDLRTRVENIYKWQGYRNGPWYYKGAKLCLIWPVWAEAFPEAKWVIVRREDKALINSCLNTTFMRAYETADGWQQWINHHKHCFMEMKASVEYMEIWPQRYVGGEWQELRNVVEWLGLRWNEDKVFRFVEPSLWSDHRRMRNEQSH